MSNISQDVFSGRMELLKPEYDYRPPTPSWGSSGHVRSAWQSDPVVGLKCAVCRP